MKAEVLNQMSLQEALDYSVKKMVEQGKCSVSGKPDNFSCNYLSVDGSRCGVGWLLDVDNLPLHEMEGRGIVSLCDDIHISVPFFIKKHQHALRIFQGIHDDASEVRHYDPFLDIQDFALTNYIDVSGSHWKAYEDLLKSESERFFNERAEYYGE